MTCISCKHEVKRIVSFPNMPGSAQGFLTKKMMAHDKPVTLNLCQCTACGLVQLDNETVSYYKDVIRAGGLSSTMLQLRIDEYARLTSYLDIQKDKRLKLIEIGCGQGEFLNAWNAFYSICNDKTLSGAIDLYGLEHCKEKASAAREQGLHIIDGFADDGFVIKEGPFDVFTQFNFLEHQPNPCSMLNCIWNNLSEGAIGLITVPSVEYILDNDGYYELIRDHLAYYSFETLGVVLRNCGFSIIDERMINRDTIEVIVRKVEKSSISLPQNDGFSTVDVSRFCASYDKIQRDVNNTINELKGKKIAIWGASHQGLTIASSTNLGQYAEYIIDSAVFKQWKYAPASHLLIVSPSYVYEHMVDAILIIAPGYTDEIAGIIQTNYPKVDILVLKDDRIRKIN